MIGSDDKEALKELLIEPMISTKAMATMFFPHHVYRPFCGLHKEIFDILDDDTIRAAALACPRGFGKTTIASLIFPLRKVLFQECKYVLLISSTFKKAVSDLKTLAAELDSNEMIRKVFGDMKGTQWAEGSGELELSTGIKIEAKGAGNQIRGLKYRQYRPDLIIIDDLEDPEEVRNEDRRKILKEWFFADLMNSIDLKRTRVVIVGTVLHEDSLISNLLEEKKELAASNLALGEQGNRELEIKESFHVVRLEAFDDNLNSNWPEYISNEEIRAKFKLYEMRGMLDVLYREYRNLPMSPIGALFEKKNMKLYRENDKDIRFANMETVVIYDPAKTINPTADPTAIVGVSFDTRNNKIYFRDCINKRIHPDEAYREALDMADRLGTANVGYEVTSLNEFITFPFTNYAKTRRRFYNLVELKARGKKEDRIRALSPFYKMGAMYHNEDINIRGALESQLLSFPTSKHDDVMDALAYILEMYDLGERFFSGGYSDSDKETIEAEYKELEDPDEYKRLTFGCAP